MWPTSFAVKGQWHKTWVHQEIFLSLMIVACQIVWYDASEISGISQGRFYDINCLLCQTAQHLTFFKLRLSHYDSIDWAFWQPYFDTLNCNGTAQTQESPCVNGGNAFTAKGPKQNVWILFWMGKKEKIMDCSFSLECDKETQDNRMCMLHLN